jgi:hypothetical protein
MGKDLTVKTLHKAVDYIVNSNEDICQVCALYNAEAFAAAAEENEDIEPCVYCRTNGKVACRNGIIEYFQGASTDGGLDMQGEPAQQPTYTGEEKPF